MDFKKNSNGNGSHDDDEAPPKPRIDLPEVFEPRCHVCQHQARRMIDRLVIMPNISFTQIAATFGVDRRSVSTHSKLHLNYEEAAIRRLIEQEAQAASEDAEEGISGALNRRLFLTMYIQRTTEALLNGELELSGKDAMAAIQMLDKVDNETEGAAVDELRLQFGAYTQAMREICSADQWNQIVTRTRQLIEVQGDGPRHQLDS